MSKKISKRQERIEFHAESHDYFATLATILCFIQNNLESEASHLQKSLHEVEHSASALKRINKDLQFLQNTFNLVKKSG